MQMRMFLGLCVNNLNQSSEEKFPTTSGDLQGFWDMLLLQVKHIDQLHEEIEMLRENNWQVKINDFLGLYTNANLFNISYRNPKTRRNLFLHPKERRW